MPLKLNVGLSRKVGEHNYGSRGASVNVEVEVDAALAAETGKLHDRIRQLFNLVRTSLTEELNGGNSNGHPADQGTGQRPAHGNSNGANRGSTQRAPRAATQSQVKAILAIARNQRVDLGQFLQQHFQVERPQDLTLAEASQVIDELKSGNSGHGG